MWESAMKLLITGADGQLAWDLAQQVKIMASTESAFSFVALNKQQLNICEPDSVKMAMQQYQPDIVINTAAYTAVDAAEQHRNQAFAVNQHGAAVIAQACAEADVPLIHMSTDYVFDGLGHHAYCENDTPRPINTYGESKWQGERGIMNSMSNYIILRVSGVFGVHGHNFVKTMIKLGQAQRQIQVIDDQITCPTPAGDIADVILNIAKKMMTSPEKSLYGIYHYCSNPPVSWYRFAQAIFAEMRLLQKPCTQDVKPISHVDYRTAAKRPLHSVLDCTKIERCFNIQQVPWQIGLKSLIRELML
ncbi:MAG: dTDP-4-dehydrorhamnose reductase [Pseudomonadota bacterium]